MMAFAFSIIFQQAQPYQNAFTGNVASIASCVIVFTYFMAIMIQAHYIDDQDPVTGEGLGREAVSVTCVRTRTH